VSQQAVDGSLRAWREALVAVDGDFGLSCVSIRSRQDVPDDFGEEDSRVLLREEVATQLRPKALQDEDAAKTLDVRIGELPQARLKQIARKAGYGQCCLAPRCVCSPPQARSPPLPPSGFLLTNAPL
jgi:hypothetical protein